MSPSEFHSRYGRLTERLHAGTPAASWGLSREAFAEALQASWSKHGAESDAEQYLGSLRLRDLALAAACARGLEPAWRQFYSELREPLRAAGRALAGDRGEELADGLFGELYEERGRLASFAGRSSLAGWLRAVLYQAYIDRLRAEKKQVSLEEREEQGEVAAAAPAADPVEQSSYERIAQAAMEAALAHLPPRRKLLLDFYYFHGLTLREAAALVGVHEATASRELERARSELRALLTSILKTEHRLPDREVTRCLYEAARGGLEIKVGANMQDRGASAVQE
jgi:RNA polymerase sigma-70 factor (ECF subfamily)